MSRYRKVDPRIWNDEKFRSLSDDGKLIFLMLLTHPSMTALGAMRGTVGGLADEIGWLPDRLRQAFGEALSKGMAKHDPAAALIALPRFVLYNAPESPNVIKAWVGALDLLPECSLKVEVVQRAVAYAEGMSEGFAKAIPEAIRKALPKPSPIQEQEPEPEQEPSPSFPSTELSVSTVGGGGPN